MMVDKVDDFLTETQTSISIGANPDPESLRGFRDSTAPLFQIPSPSIQL